MTAPLSRVLLAGGGSAGHVSPLLALAEALRRRHPGIEVVALGTETGLEQRLVPARGIPLETVPKVVFPRRVDRRALGFPRALWSMVAGAEDILRRRRPEVVVGFGGYVATPAYLAGRRLGIPLVVHEQNARPGLANRLGARLTPYVATTFPSTRLRGSRCLGMPLRREIGDLRREEVRASARAELGLRPELPTLLVTGGSLGAQRLNEAVGAAAGALRAAGVQVVHVTGAGKEVRPPTGDGPPYVVLPYVDRMETAYAAADVMVCRAGANTVCEAGAVGLPAVYVPLPIGNGEQRLNVADMIAAGGGVLVDDGDFTAERVSDTVVPLLTDPVRLAEMAAAAAATGERHGDELLADLVDEAAEAGRTRRGVGAGPDASGRGATGAAAR